MSMKRGFMRATDQQLQATAGRSGLVSRATQPNTQRGIPRVNVQSPPPNTPRHDTAPHDTTPQAPRHDTAPQAPRMGVRLRALTPPPRDTLPFSPDPEATLSYDGQLLARGFDFEARRQSTMPLSSQELERLGFRDPRAPSQRDTTPNELPVNVIPLPTPLRPVNPHPDMDLGRARHEHGPQPGRTTIESQSALIELAKLRPSPLPWVIAGIGAGFGALGLVLALL